VRSTGSEEGGGFGRCHSDVRKLPRARM
jgi:hypothetical protein